MNHEASGPSPRRLNDRVFYTSKYKFLCADTKARPVREQSRSADRAAIHPNSVAGTRIFDSCPIEGDQNSRMRTRYEGVVDGEAAICTPANDQLPQGKVHLVQ